MPTFADIAAVARELVDMTDAEWTASLAAPGIDGRALDALNRAAWLCANGLVGVADPRVADGVDAEDRTQRLWVQTRRERDAMIAEATGRHYGVE